MRMGMDSRAYCVKLLDRAEVPIASPEPWSLHVHDERLWDRLLRDRELGMGESYMDGWWSCDRLDELLTRVLSVDAASGLRVTPRLVAHVLSSRLRNHQTVRQAKHNASAHYDIGNDLYEQMLDKRMVYSCAYWRSANDLDSAQEAKLDLICRKLYLEPGMRMLDIGCGWGALAQYAAEHYGVQVVGISPAAEQVKVARERCAGLPVDIRQEDYRHVAGRFDRITSVGMMEHVGTRNLAAFFRVCDRLLSPGGTLIFSTNFRRFRLDREGLAEFAVEDLSRATLPKDFERNPRIHQCFKLTRHG